MTFILSSFLFEGLTELQMLKDDFMSLQNSVILAKCMRARYLCHDSYFIWLVTHALLITALIQAVHVCNVHFYS